MLTRGSGSNLDHAGHETVHVKPKSKILTVEERIEAGRSLHEKCPRASHGEVILGQGAKRDVIELITRSNRDRLQNLVPIRHGRMIQSAFTFFRGTAALQAYDLAGTPSSGIIVQACGDCHLLNFGGFATPERQVVFDINDFDETHRAPFEWDLKRLAASFVVAARWRGFKSSEARGIAMEAVASYRRSMKKRTKHGVLEGWYAQTTVDEMARVAGAIGEGELVKKRVAEARKHTSEQVFHKLTDPSEGGLPRIVDQPPLLYHDKRVTQKTAREFFRLYRETLPEERRFLFDRFTLVDAAVKVVGVGSVGTRCLIALFLAAPDDPLFLQIKEAHSSVLERFAGQPKAAHNGQRVVVGQRLMQSASDIFLGWAKDKTGRDFYVRQFRDMKIGPDVEVMSPKLMFGQATLSGIVLARAHDKAGDAARITGYLGGSDKFDEAIGDYAVGYADQVERDYETFVKAARDGRVKTDLSRSELTDILR
jgi:uncharacterized protein (DUF2252 family)